jgi:hypothetical protein
MGEGIRQCRCTTSMEAGLHAACSYKACRVHPDGVELSAGDGSALIELLHLADCLGVSHLWGLPQTYSKEGVASLVSKAGGATALTMA